MNNQHKAETEVVSALQNILSMYNIDTNSSLNEAEDLTDGSYEEIAQRAQQKIDELNKQADDIFKSTGMTKEELETFSKNPNNFTPEQWLALESVREACEKYKTETKNTIDELSNHGSTSKKILKQPSRKHALKKKKWIAS